MLRSLRISQLLFTEKFKAKINTHFLISDICYFHGLCFVKIVLISIIPFVRKDFAIGANLALIRHWHTVTNYLNQKLCAVAPR